MDKVLTVSEMREADNYTINVLNVPSAELMRRAGLSIADEAEKASKMLNTDEITVVCGVGNNGGDGIVCAEELRKRGYNVGVYALRGNCSDGGMREKLAYKGRYLRHITGAIVVDCIFGTGLSRKIEGEAADIIAEINGSGAYVISADIPSGLNGDNGLAEGCAVNADKTVVIGEYKNGLFLNDGLDLCGEIIKKDVGIVCPRSDYAGICFDGDVKKFFPERKRNTHKGSYGKANLVAGSENYIGAAALSVQSALMSGCGLVSLISCEKVKMCLAAKFPQAIYSDKIDLTADAIALGMGCGVSETLYRQTAYILNKYNGALVIDADGLNALAKYGINILKDKNCKVILTPHLKEFSRLCGKSVREISSSPVLYAQKFAKEFGVTLVLKSASTVICDGSNTVINVTGTTALAKGGSGDILAGYICGSLARGLLPFEAAVCSAYVLGRAAEISSKQKGDYCVTAKDIINNLHFSVKSLTE